VLSGDERLTALPSPLLVDLERHGFFGPPREPELDPPSVQIQLTNACNLTCSYCCTNSGSPREGEIEREPVQSVVARIPELLGPQTRVAILGGEPFLVSWAAELAQQVLELGLDLTIFSNGIPLADDALAARVAQLSCSGAQLRISLAGASAEACDALSGTPRFDMALRGIHNLDRHGGSCVADLMLTPQQADDVATNLQQLRARLPRGTKISLGILYLSGRERGERLFATRGEMEAALDRVAFEAGEIIAAPRVSPVTHRRDGCGCAMGRHLHLRSDGSLFTCFKMEEKVGELAKHDFGDVIHQVRAEPHPASVLPICADCPLATLCGGGCRSDNLLYSGDADVPVCGPWRRSVISELLAEDRVTVADWPVHHLLAEAHHRGIDAPQSIRPVRRSRHLLDT